MRYRPVRLRRYPGYINAGGRAQLAYRTGQKRPKESTASRLINTTLKTLAMGLAGGVGWHIGERLKLFRKIPSIGGSLVSAPLTAIAAMALTSKKRNF